MVQSIWLDFQEGVNRKKVLGALRDLYGTKSVEQKEGTSLKRWEIRLGDINFVKDFLLSKRVRTDGKRRKIVTPEAVCEHEENLLNTYMEWYALELRDWGRHPGLSLGKDIYHEHCLDYYDRLRTLGYSLRRIQRDLQGKGIESILDMGDTETHIKQSVKHYRI